MKHADGGHSGGASAGEADIEALCQMLVDAARNNPAHPAHQHLEWDDTKAAEAFRRYQAERIIRASETPKDAVVSE